jgi:hypothetical protein
VKTGRCHCDKFLVPLASGNVRECAKRVLVNQLQFGWC